MFYSVCIFSVVVFGFSAAEEFPLPPLTICEQNSTNYFNCLKLAIQEAWPQFVKGLPEFDFPPLDPITYEFGEATFDVGMVHGDIKISNFTSKGLAKTRFIGVRTHFLNNNFRLEIDVQIPKIAGTGKCDAVGTIGGIRMGGKGHFNITMEDLQGAWILQGQVANDRWTVEHVHVTPSVKKMQLYFDDFFDGNKELNDLAMMFANEYWPPIYRAMLPITSEAWDPWLCDLVNRFFSKVSFTKIFP
ncbi:uncharacterized protein [Linepithema humile]|uniref:uncharacterized protein n=1 Tax=Linepithema humile TaxID=83485 RepID=UPI00062362A6|nr:PREDICTED: uncharacterized protein LOC105668041 [Linepithema humile]